LKDITSGFSNPEVSEFARMPDLERNISMRGENVLKEYRCL